MADFLQMAEQLAASVIPKRTIAYVRGSCYISGLQATVGMTVLAYEDEHGVRQRTEMRDYLIRPEDLIIGGEQTEPMEGDKIVDTNEGGTRVYTVMQGYAAEAWRYSERYHGLIRIHTKETEVSDYTAIEGLPF